MFSFSFESQLPELAPRTIWLPIHVLLWFNSALSLTWLLFTICVVIMSPSCSQGEGLHCVRCCTNTQLKDNSCLEACNRAALKQSAGTWGGKHQLEAGLRARGVLPFPTCAISNKWLSPVSFNWCTALPKGELKAVKGCGKSSLSPSSFPLWHLISKHIICFLHLLVGTQEENI